MSFKKFISDNIVDLGHDEPKVETKNPVQKAPVKQDPPQRDWMDSGGSDTKLPDPISTTRNTIVSSDTLDQARKHFTQLLKDSHDKQKQSDYYTFIQAKNAMNSIPMEAERYKVAYAGLSAIGLTKEVILQTGKISLDQIDNELSNFSASFSASFKSQVGDNKDLIKEKQQKMIELSQQIQKLNDEIKQMNDDVARNENTLNGAKNSFERAGQESKDEINTELQKIDQYI